MLSLSVLRLYSSNIMFNPAHIKAPAVQPVLLSGHCAACYCV